MMKSKIYTILRVGVKVSKIYLCSPKEYQGVDSLPMIKFNLITEDLDLSWCDTILFSSKQAVVYADKLNSNWKNKKIIAVGPATKKKAQDLGATDVYYPKEYYGSTLAKDVIKYFNDRKILYIRPKIISFDSKTFLSNYGIDIKEQIIYETKCKVYKNINLEPKSVIIFTSPSTIECFLKNFEWNESFKAVVIGKTTKKGLLKGMKYYVANEPTIAACVEKAKEIAKNW